MTMSSDPVLILWSGWTLCLPVSSQRQGSAVERGILLSRSQTSAPPTRPLFHIQLSLTGGLFTIVAFLDSGVDANLMDESLVEQLELGLVALPHPVPATALDRHLLGTVTHQTQPVQMGNHSVSCLKVSRVTFDSGFPLVTPV